MKWPFITNLTSEKQKHRCGNDQTIHWKLKCLLINLIWNQTSTKTGFFFSKNGEREREREREREKKIWERICQYRPRYGSLLRVGSNLQQTLQLQWEWFHAEAKTTALSAGESSWSEKITIRKPCLKSSDGRLETSGDRTILTKGEKTQR